MVRTGNYTRGKLIGVEATVQTGAGKTIHIAEKAYYLLNWNADWAIRWLGSVSAAGTVFAVADGGIGLQLTYTGSAMHVQVNAQVINSTVQVPAGQNVDCVMAYNAATKTLYYAQDGEPAGSVVVASDFYVPNGAVLSGEANHAGVMLFGGALTENDVRQLHLHGNFVPFYDSGRVRALVKGHWIADRFGKTLLDAVAQYNEHRPDITRQFGTSYSGYGGWVVVRYSGLTTNSFSLYCLATTTLNGEMYLDFPITMRGYRLPGVNYNSGNATLKYQILNTATQAVVEDVVVPPNTPIDVTNNHPFLITLKLLLIRNPEQAVSTTLQIGSGIERYGITQNSATLTGYSDAETGIPDETTVTVYKDFKDKTNLQWWQISGGNPVYVNGVLAEAKTGLPAVRKAIRFNAAPYISVPFAVSGNTVSAFLIANFEDADLTGADNYILGLENGTANAVPVLIQNGTVKIGAQAGGTAIYRGLNIIRIEWTVTASADIPVSVSVNHRSSTVTVPASWLNGITTLLFFKRPYYTNKGRGHFIYGGGSLSAIAGREVAQLVNNTLYRNPEPATLARLKAAVSATAPADTTNMLLPNYGADGGNATLSGFTAGNLTEGDPATLISNISTLRI